MVSSIIGEGEGTRERGRPRGFDADMALEAAMLTFWRHGYRGTSLEQLVCASGAPRASLYRVFGDKRALFIRTLELYGRRFADRVDGIMADEPNGRAALETILNGSADRLVSADAPDGCLRCNSTLELMGKDAVIDDALRRSNDAFVRIIKKVVRRAVERGEVSSQRAAGLPVFLTAIVNGMVTLARSGADRQDLAAVIAEALAGLPQSRGSPALGDHTGIVTRA